MLSLQRLKEESSAFFSTGRLWDDGVILPQDTRKVTEKSMQIYLIEFLCGSMINVLSVLFLYKYERWFNYWGF